MDPSVTEIDPLDLDIKEEEIDLGEDVIIVSDEDETEEFLCEECGFIALSQNILVRHTTHHNVTELKMFTCGECSFKTGYKGDLNFHISVTHSPEYKPIVGSYKSVPKSEWLECDQCDYQTQWKTKFDQHYSHHKVKEKRFYCGGKCPFEAKSKEELITHISTKHTLKWCKFCKMSMCKCDNKEQRRKYGVPRHHTFDEKCNCGVGKIFKCSQCDSFKVTCRQRVLEHMRWVHRSEITDFLLSRWQKKTKVERELIMWYKCGICPFKSKSHMQVSLHLRQVHKK